MYDGVYELCRAFVTTEPFYLPHEESAWTRAVLDVKENGLM